MFKHFFLQHIFPLFQYWIFPLQILLLEIYNLGDAETILLNIEYRRKFPDFFKHFSINCWQHQHQEKNMNIHRRKIDKNYNGTSNTRAKDMQKENS
jgi:hypothetical protein